MSTLLKNYLLAIFLAFLSMANLVAEEDYSRLFATQTEFLKVDEAFLLETEIIDQEIVVRFVIADDYYMYRSRFGFSAQGASLAKPLIPDGKKKVDEYLGDVEVYYHHLEINLPFVAHQKAFELLVEFQGCAEAGLCYPPEEKIITLYADTITPLALSSSAINKPVDSSASGGQEFISEQEQVVSVLKDQSLLQVIFYFVLLGIGLAFTPCVLPMVPILSRIIIGQGHHITPGKAFGLSFAYTQAMAIPYTLIGILAAAAGQGLSNTFQEPAFIGVAVFIFVLLALGMFGFYELQMPQGLQNRLNRISSHQERGSYLGAAIMGAISSLVVSPCVTVPLAGVLIYISQTGDMLIGGVALYALAFGMGIPLLVFGVGGGKLLPKSGVWMTVVKGLFGFVMLAMALYISKHLIPGPVYLFAFAILLFLASAYINTQFKNQASQPWPMQLVKLFLLVYSAALLVGAGLGNDRLTRPLADVERLWRLEAGEVAALHSQFKRVKTIQDVEMAVRQANAEGKTLMLDFFAESCTACYEFADYTFSDPGVQAALANTVLLQADVTQNDADDKALMKHFGVIGLPSILFIGLDGQENQRLRAIGFENAERFVQRIEAAF